MKLFSHSDREIVIARGADDEVGHHPALPQPLEQRLLPGSQLRHRLVVDLRLVNEVAENLHCGQDIQDPIAQVGSGR